MPCNFLQLSWYVVTMALLINSANCQFAGLIIATVGWILSTMSMGFAEWRVWHMNNASISPPGVALVGPWKVCVYHSTSYFDRATPCHHYPYLDTYLPRDIRAAQHLLLAASILGLLGKVSVVFALRNLYLGIRSATRHPFAVPGIVNMAASACIAIAVIWSYYSMMNDEGISFPPPLSIPFKPDKQEMGNAMIVACLAAFIMMLSGLFHLSYKVHLDNWADPDVLEA